MNTGPRPSTASRASRESLHQPQDQVSLALHGARDRYCEFLQFFLAHVHSSHAATKRRIRCANPMKRGRHQPWCEVKVGSNGVMSSPGLSQTDCVGRVGCVVPACRDIDTGIRTALVVVLVHADSHDPPRPCLFWYRPRGLTMAGSTYPCAKFLKESAPWDAQLWNGLSRKVAWSSSQSLR
jgi:hypothetical protein